MRDGDQLMLTDWRGYSYEELGGPGTEVSHILADAARRGIIERALVWRSRLDSYRYHEAENGDRPAADRRCGDRQTC
jgi:hypothetical protein